jgi:hypothetical protein
MLSYLWVTCIVLSTTLLILLVSFFGLIASSALDFSIPLKPRLLANQHTTLHHSRNDSLRFKDYLLIGTHGSAAYRIDPAVIVDDRGVDVKRIAGKVTPGLIKQWALNQHYDIYSQLALGARYIHLEVAVHNGEWVTIHSFFAGTLAEDLDQIKGFLDDTTEGFALLKVQRFGKTTTDKVGKTYMDYIREIDLKYRVDGRTLTRETKLSTLMKKMIVFGTGDDGLRLELYPADYTSNVNIFDFNRNAKRIQANPPKHIERMGSLLGFQWVMTPGTRDIVMDLINPASRSGLFDFVTVKNKTKLREYLSTNADTFLKTFHIFIVDHLDPETCSCIEDYNYKRT